MRKKIFRSLIFVSVMVMLLSSAISTTFLHSYFNKEQADKLHIELELVADAVNELGVSYLEGVEDDTFRFTVINADGSVAYDTKADTETMENHADREEIIEALESGSGSSARYSENGIVIAMNASARKIFGVKKDAVGTDLLTFDRSPEISHAITVASTDGHCEIVLNKNGREYQFTISRIESDGKGIGTLILGFDITEKAFAERNRQEFTANVSHELKTPLQSIIGLSEMLENGIVKPEDTTRFAGNIRKEASRLYSLIEDIIRLSQLDEKAEPAFEQIDMRAAAAEVVEVLKTSASKRKITLSLECDNIQINGVRRYIYEIIYNLCDNAIRYNRDGGKVDIAIRRRGKNTVITIADTGIGIPVEHQARIFERFYRVDKSHSKETGGTGLGLSIVKRAVMLHGGKVELNSTIGEGTTVKVILPQ